MFAKFLFRRPRRSTPAPRVVRPGSGAAPLAERLDDLRLALRLAQKTCLTLGLLSLVCVTACLAALVLRPAPVYFGMDQEMKLLPMTPLSEPVLSESALKNWVSEAVVSSLNLDYLHWKTQLTQARACFTPRAFSRFAVSLDKEGHLPLLRQQRALMHAVVQGTPVLTRSGVVEGVRTWEYELPLLLTYETSMGRISNNVLTVTCQVRRVPVTDTPRGVAISSLVVRRQLTRAAGLSGQAGGR